MTGQSHANKGSSDAKQVLSTGKTSVVDMQNKRCLFDPREKHPQGTSDEGISYP
jgi:hypothetical protein